MRLLSHRYHFYGIHGDGLSYLKCASVVETALILCLSVQSKLGYLPKYYSHLTIIDVNFFYAVAAIIESQKVDPCSPYQFSKTMKF